MKGFKIWDRESGFSGEGVEWSNGEISIRWNESYAVNYFPSVNHLKTHVFDSCGPDTHVVFSDAGELKFSTPALLPAPQTIQNKQLAQSILEQIETANAPSRKRRRSDAGG